DIPPGLLDRLCNPRPAFRAVQTLNTILFSNPRTWTPASGPSINGATVMGLREARSSSWLIVPNGDEADSSTPSVQVHEIAAGATAVSIVALAQGTIRSQPATQPERFNIQEATLVIVDGGASNTPQR
ncbi:MAG TPA: hypothetical protein VFL82_01075, partial [Thermomicrobiales bacterium]|nr:hypothetical protein [Thermomicrobiales bacterium]